MYMYRYPAESGLPGVTSMLPPLDSLSSQAEGENDPKEAEAFKVAVEEATKLIAMRVAQGESWRLILLPHL